MSDAILSPCGTYRTGRHQARPPLGAKPRFIVDEERAAELVGALARYAECRTLSKRWQAMVEWSRELVEIAERRARDESRRASTGGTINPS